MTYSEIIQNLHEAFYTLAEQNGAIKVKQTYLVPAIDNLWLVKEANGTITLTCGNGAIETIFKKYGKVLHFSHETGELF